MKTETAALVAELQDLANQAETYADANVQEIAGLETIRARFFVRVGQLLAPAVPAIASRGVNAVRIQRLKLWLSFSGLWFADRHGAPVEAAFTFDDLGRLRISPEALVSALVDLLGPHADGHANANEDLQRERRKFQALLVLLEG